ncbi:MAG: hypothetical protein K9W42_11370 [Candidatus Heimdallarchaeota archaeon]|nr:hypothetical protein [Candidatus Heimdallarchaeota archaeon]
MFIISLLKEISFQFKLEKEINIPFDLRASTFTNFTRKLKTGLKDLFKSKNPSNSLDDNPQKLTDELERSQRENKKQKKNVLKNAQKTRK